MASSTLLLHCGARRVDRGELAQVPAPEPTRTWFPVRHLDVLDTAVARLAEAGYAVKKTELALNRANTQFFGVLDLDTAVAHGVNLAVGLRNSTDQTLPMGFAGGSRVFVCDNMAMASELLVKRKHTRFGQTRFADAITQAVASLAAFQETEASRIRRMTETELSPEGAESLILRAYLRGIVSFKLLHGIVRQWHEPAYAEWGGPTLWRLFNCFTYAMADVCQRTPHQYVNRTIRLHQLLTPFGGSSGPGGTPAATAASPAPLAA